MNIGENDDSWQINPIQKLLSKLIFFFFSLGFHCRKQNKTKQNNLNSITLEECEEDRVAQAVLDHIQL